MLGLEGDGIVHALDCLILWIESYGRLEGLILPFRDLLELPVPTLVGEVSFLVTDEASLPFSVAFSHCVEFHRSAMGSGGGASRGLFLLLVGLVTLVLGDVPGIPLVLFFYMSLVLLVINSDCLIGLIGRLT